MSMDVSFFENQPYKTQNSLQEEIRGKEIFQEIFLGKQSRGEIGETRRILENILVEEKNEAKEPENKEEKK